jgi:hypothetical protein
LFWIHYSLAELFRGRDEFNDAHAHIEQAKTHTVNEPYYLGRGMELHALIWYEQQRFEDAKLEGLCALETYGKVGATADMEDVRDLLRRVEEAKNTGITSGNPASGGKFPITIFCFVPTKSLLSVHITSSSVSADFL